MIPRCRPRQHPSAVSLVEVLIVFFIFSIVLSMVADMSRLALHSQMATTSRVEARRLASVMLNRLRFEMSTCRSLQSPAPGVGVSQWWTPTPGERLILRVNVNGGTNAVAYWYNRDTQEVWRLAKGEARPVLREVQDFEFQQVEIAGAHIMAAQVRMKDLSLPVNVWARAAR